MKSPELIEIFVESARDTQRLHTALAMQFCLEILQDKGATSKETAIIFNNENDKPCVNSENAPDNDDVASADVVRVWCNGDFIYADLYFYYLADWSYNVLITNDREFDWITLLEYLKYEL